MKYEFFIKEVESSEWKKIKDLNGSYETAERFWNKLYRKVQAGKVYNVRWVDNEFEEIHQATI